MGSEMTVGVAVIYVAVSWLAVMHSQEKMTRSLS
jgi:hypothetical protein